MASNKKNKKKVRQLHPKNRARAAAAAAAKIEEPPPSEETAAEPVSGVETSVDDDIGSGAPQEEYRLFTVGTTMLELHEFAWHLNGIGSSRLLTPEEVSEVVRDDRRWRWEAYETSDNWYVNHPYLVRYVSQYGMVMGGLYMFTDKARAVLCRDMLNSLSVMPEMGAHTPDPKEEKTFTLIDEPARHFLPCFAVEP